MPEISIMPEAFYIGGVNIGWSVVVAWCVIAVLALLLLLAQRRIRNMTEVPRGLQNFFELIVDGIYRFSEQKIGHAAEFAAPVVLTFMTYILSTTIVELFGISPSTEDINCTLALGLCAFILINVTALKYVGVRGRLRGLSQPSPAVFPIRVMIDCIAPLSMAIRLFANILVGGIIMKLIYAVLPIVAPAVVASYFNVLHTGIQTFVFGLLSLIYISEAIE